MLLSLESVAKTHWVGRREKPTLVDVSLSIDAGDFVVVWGGQRSGKSTLLRLAAGLTKPDSGVVRFDGTDLSRLSKGRRGGLRLSEIGFVRDDGPKSREFRVIDYVALPVMRHLTWHEAEKRAATALRRVGAEECRDARWMHLSDSEQALVSLARGLVREPRLLLVDDAIARLDTFQRAEVIEMLRSAVTSVGLAVLMTSSVLATIPWARHTFALSEGRFVPVGDAPAGRLIEFPGGQQSA